MPVLDPQALLENRVAAIRDFHNSVGTQKAELDVSGGVDSAVMLGLLATALGPENVVAVHSSISTNPDQTKRAHEVAEVFGVKLIEIDLGPIYAAFVAKAKDAIERAYGPDVLDNEVEKRIAADPTILGSIRSTLRAPVGRGFNRLMGGGIRHGTGNECEDRWARFFQKGGDGEVDTNPLAMLSKGEVFQLALKLGVPRSTIAATPSPDLWGTGDGHSDEDEFAAYFGFKATDTGHTFYSYIDLETGAYTKVGLIERVCRFLDLSFTNRADWDDPFDFRVERWLFSEDREPVWENLTKAALGQEVPDNKPVRGTERTNLFQGLDAPQATKLLAAARRVERQTRHKMNPNCPSLGDRSSLVEAGILTNTLPLEEA